MKYYVRTTGDRAFDYDLNYKVLIDTERKPIKSFIDQLRIISDDDAVLLEDDLILCKDFQNKIESVIEQHPNSVINFFEDPFMFYTTQTRPGIKYRYNQCTYYPKGIAKQIADKMEEIRPKYPLERQYDFLQSYAMDELGMSYISYRPCLVQHKHMDSIINPILGPRSTLYFIDYIDETGVDYKDALLVKNHVLLQKAKSKHLLS
jgi:hypothetical protein